jgi:hypothetical protein
MAERHVIDVALDLARMPVLARTSILPSLPPNIIELMRIAAASPEACEAAVAKTGEPTAVVIEAARFYLQQVLFRPEADCYRILGIAPNASRATARSHMRLLLQWLHPDRNHNSWDAVYAERVVKAWREVSASDVGAAKPRVSRARSLSNKKKNGDIEAIWVPWIEHSGRRRSLAMQSSYRALIIWALPTGLAIILLAVWSAGVLLRP